ncbi:MAG: hypothetical protein EOO23_04625 [Comamonadaceae bacterium]|nr:MAG: hypothetical protein EOO23_04625 [Comamonadaceae bacterium]
MIHHTQVFTALKAGNNTAVAVRNATGLAHETVYQALAWLEARGMAFLTCAKGSDGRVKTDWGVN